MSVPFFAPRSPTAPLKRLRDVGITNFYWQYFQTPGAAEAEFERDVDHTVGAMLYGTGGSPMMKPGQGFLTAANLPNELPAWVTEENISYYVQTYKNSGFRGGLNWCRNIDRNWVLSGGWEGLKIQQPALFVAGSEDGVIKGFAAKALEQLPTTLPGLKRPSYFRTAAIGFSTTPREVNVALLEFLRSA